MLVFSSLYLLSALIPALASPHAPDVHRRHHEVAKRMEGTVAKRFSGVRMTFYGTDTGADACTGRNHGDNDWVVAISTSQGMSHCNKKVKISYKGKSTTATVIDLCASCDFEQIDLTKGLFKFFAPLDQGIFQGDWEFVDGNGGGDDNKGDDNKNDDKGDDNKGDDKKDDDKPKPPPKKEEKEKPKATPTPPPKQEPKKEDKEEEKKTTEQPKPSSTPKPSSSAKPSSSVSVSAHVASSAPVVPPKPSTTTTVDGVANAGGDPTSGLSGGIGSGSDNGALSHTINMAAVSVSALILLAVQAL